MPLGESSNIEFNTEEINEAVNTVVADKVTAAVKAEGEKNKDDDKLKSEHEVFATAGKDKQSAGSENNQSDEEKAKQDAEKKAAEDRLKQSQSEAEKNKPIDQAGDIFKELQEKYGITTKEELDRVLSERPKVAETPVEKEKREKSYNANLDKFLQDNDIMKREEIVRYESIKGKADKDLAIETFISEFKEDNPKATQEEIDYEVESRYHLESTDEILKKRGERLLAKDAKEVKRELETKFNSGKSEFDAVVTDQAQVPSFNKFVDSYSKKIPTTIEVYKKDDIAVNFEVSAEVKKEVADTIRKDYTLFKLFAKHGDSKEVNDYIEQKKEELIWVRNRKEINSVIAEATYSKGLKSGSTVGAKNPFPVAQENNKSKPSKASTEEAKGNVVKYMTEDFH